MNWRSIPHPHYGNYGGGSNKGRDYTKNPIDEMDAYFKLHDLELLDANGNKVKEYLADSTLFLNLVGVELNELAYPFYGRLYWFGATVVFAFIYYFRQLSE